MGVLFQARLVESLVLPVVGHVEGGPCSLEREICRINTHAHADYCCCSCFIWLSLLCTYPPSSATETCGDPGDLIACCQVELKCCWEDVYPELIGSRMGGQTSRGTFSKSTRSVAPQVTITAEQALVSPMS